MSVGERSLVSLARALAKNARVVVLDEVSLTGKACIEVEGDLGAELKKSMDVGIDIRSL